LRNFRFIGTQRSTWLISSLSPGAGEKISKHSVPLGTSARCWRAFGVQAEDVCADREILPDHSHSGAGLDGSGFHRMLQKEGIESHVVDPASIPRRLRRHVGGAAKPTYDVTRARATGI